MKDQMKQKETVQSTSQQFSDKNFLSLKNLYNLKCKQMQELLDISIGVGNAACICTTGESV